MKAARLHAYGRPPEFARLDDIGQVYARLKRGAVRGRAVITP